MPSAPRSLLRPYERGPIALRLNPGPYGGAGPDLQVLVLPFSHLALARCSW